jgi:hypothetical protein
VDVVAKEAFATWASLPRSAELEGDGNGSGFYFLCEEQKRMVLPFQMSGQHKLWKLEKKIAERASKQLKACEQMPIDFRGHRDGKFPARTVEVEDEVEDGGYGDDEEYGEYDGGGGGGGEEEEAAVAAASRAALASEEEEQVALAMAMSLSITDR